MPHPLVRVITSTLKVGQGGKVGQLDQYEVTTNLVKPVVLSQPDSSVQLVKEFGIVLKSVRPKIGGYTIVNVQRLLRPGRRNSQDDQITTMELLAEQGLLCHVRAQEVLIGFFMIVVAMLLGFMGYILVLNLIQVLRIPLDYITMSFALWNFAVAGLLSVFWKGPMWLQQVYLTFMSSLMAFSLTGLAEWTTWMLLALLVVWDLIAVLCPFGPLKILVESSRNQNQEVPALLYTVNAVWFMASPPDSILARGASPSKEVAAEDLLVVFSEDRRESKPFNGQYPRGVGRESFGSGVSNTFSEGEASLSSTMGLVPAAANGSAVGRDNIELQERANSRGSVTNPRSESSPLAGRAEQSSRARGTRSQADGERNEEQGEEEEDDDDGGGLKLGLGDFVFYSLLISRAASFDWVTTMCCMVAVLTKSV
ncbi:Presenilin-1 [Entomortierella chlamydospora]|uniref:Presenilin n=1 Tax=Entomortierella chlamydospora TaxID=101097 RepID=A0A9P6MV43_9FUNG|nr:Presenilin-1 [Entomortierella chlamydospora]